jgi:copper(I)-binding protein
MTNLSRQAITGLLFAAIGFGASAMAGAQAHEFKLGDLAIGHPWTRETPNGAKVAGGYLSVTNNGKESDRLVGGTLEASERLEIHEMKMDGDVMRMRPLNDGIDIKPGETIKLAPGGVHLMFLDLKRPLKKDELVKGQLQFQKAGKVDVEFKVDAVGVTAPAAAHKH